MEKLVKLALLVLAELRLAQRVSDRVTGTAMWLVLAVVTAVGAGGAAVAAVWLYLTPRIGADGAALSIAAVLGVSSTGFFLLARGTMSPQRDDRHGDGVMSDELACELRRSFGRHKGTALVSALLAGLAVGTQRK